MSARVLGALTARRPADEAFAAGAEIRLGSFADLAAQSIANEQAHEEMRASRARIVHAADQARERLERNLHDGAQQRLVAVSISLRLALSKLEETPEDARMLLAAASDELTQAMEELRELARGIHPSVLTDCGLGRALQVLAARAPMQVSVVSELEERLPAPVEAAAYYVVAESLTNVAKYAEASRVDVRVSRRNGTAVVEVVDDGIGGADASRGSGIRGLIDRVEALDGRLELESPLVRRDARLGRDPAAPESLTAADSLTSRATVTAGAARTRRLEIRPAGAAGLDRRGNAAGQPRLDENRLGTKRDELPRQADLPLVTPGAAQHDHELPTGVIGEELPRLGCRAGEPHARGAGPEISEPVIRPSGRDVRRRHELDHEWRPGEPRRAVGA